MVRPAINRNHYVVDLTSDDEDEDVAHNGIAVLDAVSVEEPTDNQNEFDIDQLLHGHYQHSETDHQEIIDLTAIPDVDVPPSDSGSSATQDVAPSEGNSEAELVTEAICLQLVLDVLPDVSTDHVLTLIKTRTTDQTRTKAHSEQIVNELLEGTYPKETDRNNKKRRRIVDSDDVSDYEKDERDPGVLTYDADAVELLKDEFLSVPVRHITNTFKQSKTLFKAYTILEGQVRNYQQVARAFVKPPRPRNKRGTELVLIERGNRLPKELRAAKRKIEKEVVKRRKIEEEEQAEEANLQQAKMNNQMGECQCCFTEYPLNRMIGCGGKDTHLFCMDCPRQYIENEMGQSKCRPVCFASTECKSTFSRKQLKQVLSDRTFERLEHMQQQEDLAAAGLDFLSECPFCDFKMECPPVDEDREFRCQSKKCGKTSCRLCQKETHIPLTCEEAQKDDKLTLRHVVEEAMSAALIRKCNKCNHPFVKDHGCNKMSCTHCGNKQCYICSKNVNNYEHFGDVNKGRCALHDNVEDVHEQEVKKAAEEAMAKVKAENPTLSDADLMVEVSDRVKQAELARRGRAAQRLNRFPFHMVGPLLAHRDGLVGEAPPPPRDRIRPPARPPPRFDEALGAAYNRLAAAVGAQHGFLAQAAPLAADAPPHVLQLQAYQRFRHAINPPARVDAGVQAAQDRYQQQLRGAHRAHMEMRRLNEEALQAQFGLLDDVRGDARRRVRHAFEGYDEPRGLHMNRQPLHGAQAQNLAHAPNMAQAQHRRQVQYLQDGAGLGVPAMNAGNVGAGVGVGFDGIYDDDARRDWMNRWFEEQLRDVPRG
ncbi:RBR-type E3 ubiquitin transferase [Ascochyta lentis]